LRNSYTKILIGKPEGKKLLGTFSCRWESNNEIGLKETGCEGVDWIHLAQEIDQWRALAEMIMRSASIWAGGGGDFLIS
jgi:hypothetical protein